MPIRSYESDYDVQMEIQIEMNMNQMQVVRDGYTLLDLISDIGGLQGILISGSAILLSVWNYNNLDNFLVSKLYKIAPKNKDGPLEKFVPQKLRDPIDFFCDMMP